MAIQYTILSIRDEAISEHHRLLILSTGDRLKEGVDGVINDTSGPDFALLHHMPAYHK